MNNYKHNVGNIFAIESLPLQSNLNMNDLKSLNKVSPDFKKITDKIIKKHIYMSYYDGNDTLNLYDNKYHNLTYDKLIHYLGVNILKIRKLIINNFTKFDILESLSLFNISSLIIQNTDIDLQNIGPLINNNKDSIKEINITFIVGSINNDIFNLIARVCHKLISVKIYNININNNDINNLLDNNSNLKELELFLYDIDINNTQNENNVQPNIISIISNKNTNLNKLQINQSLDATQIILLLLNNPKITNLNIKNRNHNGINENFYIFLGFLFQNIIFNGYTIRDLSITEELPLPLPLFRSSRHDDLRPAAQPFFIFFDNMTHSNFNNSTRNRIRNAILQYKTFFLI